MSHSYRKEAMSSKHKKLQSYTSADPHQKVDSSDWTPAEALNTEAKTGMRPVSKRKFKRGGKVLHKVEGAHSKARHDRKARKSGGKSGETPIVDRYINRDMNKANDYRDGKKHVGGMKKGGRANKDMGGGLSPMNPVMAAGNRINAMNAGANIGLGGITPGMPTGSAGKSILRSKALGFKKGGHVHPDVAEDKALIKKMVKPSAMKRSEHCWGGKAEPKKEKGGSVFSGDSKTKIPGAVGGRKAKADGGNFRSELTQYEKARRPAVEAADDYLMDSANNEDKLRSATRNFERVADETGYSNRKHGGRSKHAAGGRKAKADGGRFGKLQLSSFGEKQNRLKELKEQMLRANPRTTNAGDWGDMQAERSRLENDIAESSKGMKGMGRTKHASGGRAKGKTDIKIIVAPHSGQPQASGIAQMAGGMPPQPVPQPNRPPQGGMPMAGGFDPNLAVAALANRGAQPQPQPQMPMGRKTGGRVARTEHVIDHAAGGGLGRLEKIKAYGHK